MRILWVKVGGLWPLNTGGRQRTFHMLAELARRHDVTLVTTHAPADAPAQLRAELPQCARVVSFPFAAPKQGSAAFIGRLMQSWISPLPVDLLKWRVPAVRAFVRSALAAGEADLVIADFLVAVPNVPLDAGVPVVCFSHNVEHQIWRRLHDVETRWTRRRLLDVEWRKVRRAERDATRRTALTIAVSSDDRKRLAADAPGAVVLDIPTGVDVAYFAPRPVPEVQDRLVFSGSMDWYPNEDAMLHFIANVFPAIRRVRPGITLTIVGRRPGERLRTAAAAVPGVTVTGTVDDVRPHVEAASVYIVPLRVGGGTRLKIFEALAMGKAVVSTTVGAEGLDIVDGEHLRLADGDDAFASSVLALLADAEARRALGAAGRRLVVERYSWASVTDVFERHLARLLESAAPDPDARSNRLELPRPEAQWRG